MTIMNFTLFGSFTITAIVNRPTGRNMPSPTRVFAHIYWPAKGEQKFQEMWLNISGRFHILQNLKYILIISYTEGNKRSFQNKSSEKSVSFEVSEKSSPGSE